MGKLISTDGTESGSYKDPSNVHLLTQDFLRLATCSAVDRFPFIQQWRSQEQIDEVNHLLQSSKEEAAFLRSSLFEHMPPTIRFYGETKTVKKPCETAMKDLLWAYNSLLPIPMRKVLRQSHFSIKPVEEESKWIGYWGRHWRSEEYKGLTTNQRVNHYPGSIHIGRKDKIWVHLQEFEQLHGDGMTIMPETFLMPDDMDKLTAYLTEDEENAVIIKPPASARGVGISIISKVDDIPELDLSQKKYKFWIAQKYIQNPFLIDGKKFDLRIYAYAPSLDPLTIYIYDDGLVRFASLPYSSDDLSNEYVHLTNYSINKHAVENGVSNIDVDKWRLKDFWKYLEQQKYNPALLKAQINDMIVKTIMACEVHIRNYMINSKTDMSFCHELFGFDILVDTDLKPWILEANLTPSLQAHTLVDRQVKWPLVRDVLNMCRYPYPVPPNKLDNSLGHATRHCNGNLTKNCVNKISKVMNEYQEKSQIPMDILDEESVTGTDIRCICHFEDEFECRGGFRLIYPNPNLSVQDRYFKYIQNPSYFDILMHSWMTTKFSSKTNQEKMNNLIHKMCYLGNHIVTDELRF